MEQRRDIPTAARTRNRAANKGTTTPLLQGPQVTKRKPIPRKGHKKSRAGCIVCKRRKVKCDEVAPACGQCERLGLECSYPPQPEATPGTITSNGSDDGNVGKDSTSKPVIKVQKPLQSELASFTITDLKFFQHFLFAAYPTLPVGGWEVWQDVSQLAHQGKYDFLIHAMLGLGASHLGMLNNQGYMKEALSHRVKAIKSLNQFLSQGYADQTDADAAFAAVLSLTFQSAYISDGLADFLSMIRGCFVVGVDAINETSLPRFRSMSRAVYIQKVKGLLDASASDASLDLTVIQGFCTSLKNLRPLCETTTDLEYIDRIHRVAIFAATDPLQAYLENSHLYSGLGDLSNEDFARFSDPDRPISRLIIMHLLCLDLVMSRKEIEEGDEKRTENPGIGNWDYRQNMAARWVVGMQKELPEAYQDYGLWVAEVSRGFRYSCEGPNETWRPFMLHKGKATMRISQALQDVPEHLTCFEEPLPDIPYLVNDVNLPLRPVTPV